MSDIKNLEKFHEYFKADRNFQIGGIKFKKGISFSEFSETLKEWSKLYRSIEELK